MTGNNGNCFLCLARQFHKGVGGVCNIHAVNGNGGTGFADGVRIYGNVASYVIKMNVVFVNIGIEFIL